MESIRQCEDIEHPVHGELSRREPTFSEIVALRGALQIDLAKLITLPILTPVHS